MIGVLGFKRIMIVLFLVAVNALLAAALYLYLVPELSSMERKVRAERAAESEVRTDIANIQAEFDQLETQQDAYETLREDGFFSNQSRRDAQVVFTEAKAYSDVTEANVTVRSGLVVEDENAAKADQVMLESPVSINFTSVDDIDIYEYIHYLEQVFPGYLSVESFNLNRNANISDTMLRAIATGATPPLVTGSVELTWHTMVSREDYFASPEQEGVQ
jgi:DNA-binding protein H-NS